MKLFNDFILWEPSQPRDARQLARQVARLCRFLREEVIEQLAAGSEALTHHNPLPTALPKPLVIAKLVEGVHATILAGGSQAASGRLARVGLAGQCPALGQDAPTTAPGQDAETRRVRDAPATLS